MRTCAVDVRLRFLFDLTLRIDGRSRRSFLNAVVTSAVEQSESDGKAAIYVAAFVLHNGDSPLAFALNGV